MLRHLWTRAEHRALLALVILYLICAVGFAIATPYGEGPDEFLHLRYIEYLIVHGKLPPIQQDAYTAESTQPPLYYFIGAGLVLFERDVVNHPLHRLLVPPPVGNPAFPAHQSVAVLLHPLKERWLFWPYILRAQGILFGLGTLLLTYATTRLLVPAPAPALAALLATAVAALVPEMNFIRAIVTNENLAALIGSWIVWLVAQHLTQPASRRRIGWLAVAFGLGALTKLSVLALLVPVVWVLWLRRHAPRDPDRRHAWHIAAPVWVGVVLFYGWRWAAYGDPLASAAWRIMLPTDSTYRLTDLFWFTDPFRTIMWNSFWGFYGWQLIPMPGLVYTAVLGLTLLAVAGGSGLLLRRSLTPAQQAGCAMCIAAVLAAYGVVILLSLRLIAWQSRELYPALSSVCVLFGVGLAGVALGAAATQPRRPLSRVRSRLAGLLLPAVTLSLVALNLYSIVWLVGPLLNGYK